MGKLEDLDITGKLEEKSYQDLGKAHEHIAAGILMRVGFDYMSLDYQGKPYDGITVAYDRNPKRNNNAKEVMLRTQVRTAKNSISLKGGKRSGKDREYKSDVKEYEYTREHADLMIGVSRENLDLYIIPVKYCEKWGSSKAVSKLEPLKNRWDLLTNWTPEHIEKVKHELPDFSKE